MSGALQAVFQNQRSFGLTIGNAYQGGFYAGQISTAGNGIADYNLVIGPIASAQAGTTLQFKTINTNDSGATSTIDGPSNSSSMNDVLHPAAQFCEGLTIGGFSDWYLPAKNELEVCYYNLKPTTTTNNTGANAGGINSNAVPARTVIYTSGSPAQTSANNFKNTGTENFAISAGYWSSTQNSATGAWIQTFNNGIQYNNQYGTNKDGSVYVRAIRRVAI